MSITKQQREMAYNAGRAAMSEPPERRTPSACPFGDTHPEQRAAWLDGFGDALEETPPVADLKSELKAARTAGQPS